MVQVAGQQRGGVQLCVQLCVQGGLRPSQELKCEEVLYKGQDRSP